MAKLALRCETKQPSHECYGDNAGRAGSGSHEGGDRVRTTSSDSEANMGIARSPKSSRR